VLERLFCWCIFLRAVVRMERIERQSLPLRKLNWQGWIGRLYSRMRKKSRKKQLSLRKKSKHGLLQRFVRLPKLCFSLFKSLKGRSDLRESYANDDTNHLNINYQDLSIVKLQNVKSRQSKDWQNDNEVKNNYVNESCQSKTPPAKWRDGSVGDKCGGFNIKNYGCPNLSSMHNRNFRVGLYLQLNVVGRRSKLPWHYCSSSFCTNRQHYPTFERSKPIAINKERTIDYYDGCDNDCEGPIGPASQSDNEDVFAIDII